MPRVLNGKLQYRQLTISLGFWHVDLWAPRARWELNVDLQVAHSSICTGWWRNRVNSLLSIIVISDAVAICIEIGINHYGPILTGLAGVNPVAMTDFG